MSGWGCGQELHCFVAEDIENEMRRLFNVPEDVSTRLWNKYSGETLELLSKPEQTLVEAGLFENQLLVLEKQIDGQWQRKTVITGRVNGCVLRNYQSVSNASFIKVLFLP